MASLCLAPPPPLLKAHSALLGQLGLRRLLGQLGLRRLLGQSGAPTRFKLGEQCSNMQLYLRPLNLPYSERLHGLPMRLEIIGRDGKCIFTAKLA